MWGRPRPCSARWLETGTGSYWVNNEHAARLICIRFIVADALYIRPKKTTMWKCCWLDSCEWSHEHKEQLLQKNKKNYLPHLYPPYCTQTRQAQRSGKLPKAWFQVSAMLNLGSRSIKASWRYILFKTKLLVTYQTLALVGTPILAWFRTLILSVIRRGGVKRGFRLGTCKHFWDRVIL